MDRFGEKLRTLRLRRGLTLKEAARQLGYVSHGYLSELESARKVPTAALVVKAAKLFGVSTDVLLDDDTDLPNSANL